MIIDVEHHLHIKDVVKAGRSPSGKICERFWTEDGRLQLQIFKDASRVEKSIQFMDEAGIDMAMLTTNPELNLEQSKKWNDFCAKIVKENPKRFVGFASIPPLGGKPALEELERAIKDLGLKGVHIWTVSNGIFLDSEERWPFYERVAELGIPIDVHISGGPPGFDTALQAPYALYYVVAREFDMAATVLRLCLGGVLEDFPDLVFIMNHFGGGVSSVIERVDAYMSYVGPGWPDFYFGKRLISKPWREYFDKLYFNMAGREVGTDTAKCALTNINPKKLMFGSDWPFNFDGNPEDVKGYVGDIRKLDLPKEDIDDMLGGNAARILGIENA
jgi:predicted TIM-barrel fold metal-dependent hydrolase